VPEHNIAGVTESEVKTRCGRSFMNTYGTLTRTIHVLTTLTVAINQNSLNFREHQKINYPILWDGHPARP
jgi:hypothetical protein